MTAGRNSHGTVLEEIKPEAKVCLLRADGEEIPGRVLYVVEGIGVADLLGPWFGEQMTFDVRDVLWIDPMCDCGSYDCHGECCGIGYCSCTQPIVHRCPAPGEGLTQCCGQHPSDAGGQITTEPGLVTCSG